MEQDGAESADPSRRCELLEASGSPDDEKVAVAAAEVAWLEVLYEGLQDGTRSWADWDRTLESRSDRTELAISRCWAALENARDELRALRQPGNGQP